MRLYHPQRDRGGSAYRPDTTVKEARKAAEVLIAKGAGMALITLGEKGALLHGRGASDLIPPFAVGRVVETPGAGDAFNGGFAVGLSQGMTPADAVKLGCAVAGISVTRQRCQCQIARKQ